MTEKKSVKTGEIQNLGINSTEISTVENYISQILFEDNFNKLNNLQNRKSLNSNDKIFESKFRIASDNGNIEFISVDINSLAPYSTIISEEKFYEIIGKTKKGLSKRSGKYQESLYSYYLKAINEKDDGFISDVLSKAVVFENNLNYVKMLMKNKKFMKEWRKNFGKESPIKIFKESGNLRKINIINEYSK